MVIISPAPCIGRKPPSSSSDGRFYQELPETAKKGGKNRGLRAGPSQPEGRKEVGGTIKMNQEWRRAFSDIY
jgi:hypothetical protein